MGISALGGASNRLITKSGSLGAILLPDSTGTGANTALSDQGYGAWAQIVASTSTEYLLTGVTARTVGAVPTSRTGPIIVNLATGGSGSESIIAVMSISGSDFNSTTPNVVYGGTRDLAVPIRVAAGTRLAFRVALYGANSTATGIIVMVHAVAYANIEGN